MFKPSINVSVFTLRFLTVKLSSSILPFINGIALTLILRLLRAIMVSDFAFISTSLTNKFIWHL